MNTVVVSDLQDRPEIFFGEISVSATKMNIEEGSTYKRPIISSQWIETIK